MKRRLAFLFAVLACTAPDLRSLPVQKELRQILLPGKTWLLEMDLTGFKIGRSFLGPGGQYKSLQASNPATGMELSLVSERPPRKGDANTCRDYYWNSTKNQLAGKIRNATLTELGHMPAAAYVTRTNENTEKQNVMAFLATEDAWTHIHLSRPKAGEWDPLFEEFLKTVRMKRIHSRFYKFLEFIHDVFWYVGWGVQSAPDPGRVW